MSLKRSSTSRRLKVLARLGWSLIGTERALELPFGCLQKIMNCEVKPTPEEVTLIKTIYHFPFLVDAYDYLTTMRPAK